MLANSPKLVAHNQLRADFRPDTKCRATHEPTSFAPKPSSYEPQAKSLKPEPTNPYLLALYHCGEATF